MIELDGRRIFEDGTVICDQRSIMELLYQNKSLDGVISEPCEDIELYRAANRMLDSNFANIETASDQVYGKVEWSEHWLTPEPYASIDVKSLCMSKCQDQTELDRAIMELDLFEQRGMIPVLQHLLYLMDDWRQRGVVWGVGRGSSVGSFVLYLIGINRINPMEWGLGIEEFLK